MFITKVKGKIHRAVVTQAELNYENKIKSVKRYEKHGMLGDNYAE